MIQRDVTHGRSTLNFSEWNSESGSDPYVAAGLLLAGCSNVQRHEMPKPGYALLHPEARLSPEEIGTLCQWMKNQAVHLTREPAAAGGASRLMP